MSGWFGGATPAAAAPTTSNGAKVKQKVFYIGVWKSEMPASRNMKDSQPANELAKVRDLSFLNYFEAKVAGETMDFVVKTAAESEDARKGVKQQIDIQGKYALHSRGVDATPGLVGVVIVEAGYSAPAAHSLLNKILKDFIAQHPRPTWINSKPTFQHPEWMKLMKQYDEPEKADDLANIQRELDETKATLHKTIEAVLQRGEKLDDLVAKSDQLSFASRGFYAASKKQNSCCILM